MGTDNMTKHYIILFLFINYSSLLFIICHQSHGSNDQHRTMHDPKMSQDLEHVKEHLKDKIDIDREISTEELEFYYFLEHDFNNDSRLDGLEILAAIKHSELAHEFAASTANLTDESLKKINEKELKVYTELIDDILKEDDQNNDGYISYLEYAFARRREDKEAAER